MYVQQNFISVKKEFL